MSEPEVNIHVLDAAYKPFPPFAEWAARTSVDSVRWNRYKAELESKASIPSDALKRAYEIVKRAAALDTGAIEGLYEVDRGFTFTVAMETTAWEFMLAEKGPEVRPLFEAQLHAYDYVLDFATKAEPISEAAIRKLHEVVCSAQATYRVQTAVGPQEQELPKGRYKVLPNHVRTRDGADHSYAPVDVTPAEMARLVSEMRTDAFLAAHPVLQAAYAHYGLVVIHPFADGNGRVARALASAFTYRAISMPIMILSEHKNTYLDALEKADGDEYQVFQDFMLARGLDTLQLVSESLGGTPSPTPEESLAAIDELYFTRGGYTHEQVDEAGENLLKLVLREVTKGIAQKASPRIRGQASIRGGSTSSAPPAHRTPFNGGRNLFIVFSSVPPVQASTGRQFDLFVPKNAGGEDDVLLRRSDGGETFGARMDEITSANSGVLQIRLAILAERIVREMLAELKLLAEKFKKDQR